MARSPPDGSRAQFWAALRTMGRERAGALFERHREPTAALLRAAAVALPPLLTLPRLEAESRRDPATPAPRAACPAAALAPAHSRARPPSRQHLHAPRPRDLAATSPRRAG